MFSESLLSCPENRNILSESTQGVENFAIVNIKLVTPIDCNPFRKAGLVDKSYENTHKEKFFLSAPPTDYGKLTPFWAQGLIGSDIAKEYLSEYESTLDTPRIVIIDRDGVNPAGLNETRKGVLLIECAKSGTCEKFFSRGGLHGTKVSSLLFSNSSVGTSYNGKLSQIGYVKDEESIGKLALEMKQEKNYPDILSMSGSFDGKYKKFYTAQIRQSMEEISSRSLTVMSAGNSYPEPISFFIKDHADIIVGSLTPDGLPSLSSQNGESVLITAPSDSYLSAENHKGEPANFGDTSGAQPLVAGSISNMLSLYPVMSEGEIKSVIKITAIKTSAYNQKLQGNGAGSINAYKMVRVAERLRSKKYSLSSEAETAKVLNFSDEARNSYLEAKRLLNASQCELYKKGVNLLRKAWFLDPDNSSYKMELSNQYKKYGYVAESSFVDGSAIFSDRLDKDIQFQTLIKKNNPKLIISTMENEPIERQVQLFSLVMSYSNEKNLLPIIEHFYSKDLKNKTYHFKGVNRDLYRSRMGGESDVQRFRYIKILFKSNDERLQLEALKTIKNFKSTNKANQALELLINSKDIAKKILLIENLSKTRKYCTLAISKLKEDEDLVIKRKVRKLNTEDICM